MPRTATARPPGEHLALLTRVQNQIGADKAMGLARRKKILEALSTAVVELQKEVVKR